MITSRRRGFFTASLMILLLIFAVSAAALSLVGSADFSQNCIGLLDSRNIQAQKDLRSLEDLLNEDLRFPDYFHFQEFLSVKNYLRIVRGSASLLFLNTVTTPSGEIIHRFEMTQIINGREHIRAIHARPSSDGTIELFMSGIKV